MQTGDFHPFSQMYCSRTLVFYRLLTVYGALLYLQGQVVRLCLLQTILCVLSFLEGAKMCQRTPYLEQKLCISGADSSTVRSNLDTVLSLDNATTDGHTSLPGRCFSFK